MRKIKEVLRLRFELGLGQRQIARSCGMGLGTVHEYLERAVAVGIGWPLPVSYTHLDVYKRQATNGTEERAGVGSHLGAAYRATRRSCLLYTSRCV